MAWIGGEGGTQAGLVTLHQDGDALAAIGAARLEQPQTR